MIDIAFGVALAAALSTSGWALYRVAKIDDLAEEIKYVRNKVDGIYDFLIGK